MRILNRLVFLFIYFRGRIGRKTWWLGFSLLIMISTIIGLLANPPAFDGQTIEAAKPPLWLTFLSLVLFVPMLALTVKRLNDRDQPGWVRYIFGALGVSSVFTPYFAPFAEPQKLSTAEWAILAIPALIGLWFFIDNGFLKGTPGPNRYGPDPLDPASGSGTGSPVPIRTRRTHGAWLRDGFVGVLGCIVAAFLLLPSLSIESAVTWGMEKLLPSIDDLIDPYKEMKAQPAAWKAFKAGEKAAEDQKYEEAIEHYTQAIDAYGRDTRSAGKVLMARGYALRKLGRHEQSIKNYSAAIAIEPDAAHRYSSRGFTYMNLEQYERAIQDFDEAIRLSPDSPHYYRERGDALRQSGRYAEALATHNKSIEIAEQTPEQLDNIRADAISRSLVGRAETYRDMNDHVSALSDLDRALAVRPDLIWGYLERGWIYEKQGQIDKARADYEKAAELGEPNDWLKRALERVSQN